MHAFFICIKIRGQDYLCVQSILWLLPELIPALGYGWCSLVLSSSAFLPEQSAKHWRFTGNEKPLHGSKESSTGCLPLKVFKIPMRSFGTGAWAHKPWFKALSQCEQELYGPRHVKSELKLKASAPSGAGSSVLRRASLFSSKNTAV